MRSTRVRHAPALETSAHEADGAFWRELWLHQNWSRDMNHMHTNSKAPPERETHALPAGSGSSFESCLHRQREEVLPSNNHEGDARPYTLQHGDSFQHSQSQNRTTGTRGNTKRGTRSKLDSARTRTHASPEKTLSENFRAKTGS